MNIIIFHNFILIRNMCFVNRELAFDSSSSVIKRLQGIQGNYQDDFTKTQCQLQFLNTTNFRTSTSPCNEQPANPHFCGVYRGIYLFLFWFKTRDCRYALEVALTSTHNLCLHQNLGIYIINTRSRSMKIRII